jgi:hypothetical protein
MHPIPFLANTAKVPPKLFATDFTGFTDGNIIIRAIRAIRGSILLFGFASAALGIMRISCPPKPWRRRMRPSKGNSIQMPFHEPLTHKTGPFPIKPDQA